MFFNGNNHHYIGIRFLNRTNRSGGFYIYKEIEQMNELAAYENKLTIGCFNFDKTGLVVNGDPTFEEWKKCGEFLKQAEKSVQFWIGDWLNYGEHRWGEMYTQAIEITGQEYKTVRNEKWVSSKIELSRRRDNLSFSHHAEVAQLEPEEQDYWLDKAEEEGLSRNELRKAIRHAKTLLNPPELPSGKYNVIYIDPPWPVESIVMEKWETPIEDKYSTMTLEEIAALPIAKLAHDTCSLFLWTTHAFLPSAFELIKNWGFTYFCCITWDKGGGWTQNGFHKRTEFLLYSYRGGINIDQYGNAIPTMIQEKKTVHSKKPDSIRELITSKTPEPRIELFARQKSDGWSVWGNEV